MDGSVRSCEVVDVVICMYVREGRRRIRARD